MTRHDYRKIKPGSLAASIHQSAADHGLVYVSVKGWIVTTSREFIAGENHVAAYDKRATAEHIMHDLAAEIGGVKRH